MPLRRIGMVTFHPQGHVDEARHKVIRCNETKKKKKKLYPIERRLKKKKKQRKVFFLGKKIML
jgi:hypothetical protein